MISLTRIPAAIKGAAFSIAMGVGSFIDHCIAVGAPTYALQRKASRAYWSMLAAHEAAKKDRTRADWGSKGMSADAAVLEDLPTITARARMSQRDDWCGKSISNAFVRNVVGVGIRPMAAAIDAEEKPRKKFNKTLNKLWRRYHDRPDVVDVEGRKTFNAMIRLMESEWVTAGGGFLVWSYKPRPDNIGLQFQMFELEQLAADDECSPQAGNEIRNGVEIHSATGRPVAYWVHTKEHPLDGAAPPVQGSGTRYGFDKPRRIPAAQVLHLSRQTRPRETLAASRLTPVLSKMWGQKRYDDQEQIAKGIESFLAFAIKKNPAYGTAPIGFAPASNDSSVDANGVARDGRGNRLIDFEPGAMPELFPGEEIQMFDPRRPGMIYGEYTDRQIGMIGAGVDLSFATVNRDYSKGNFSSQRQGRLEDEKAFDIDQDDLIDLVLRPIWRLFVLMAYMEGKIDAPGFVTPEGTINEDYLEVDWQPPARPWVDPAKEAAAAKIRLDYRLDDRGRILNEQGRDWRETFERIKEQSADADSKGILLPEEAELEPKVSPSEPKPRGKAAKPRTMSLGELIGALVELAVQNQSGSQTGRSDAIGDELIREAIHAED